MRPDPSTKIIRVPLTLRHCRGKKTVVPAPECGPDSRKTSDAFLKALAKAHRWRTEIEAGSFSSVTDLARAKRVNQSYACRILRLSLLSPQVVEAVLDNTMSRLHFKSFWQSVPMLWSEQCAPLFRNVSRISEPS